MNAQNDTWRYPVGVGGLDGDAQLLQDQLADPGSISLAAGCLHNPSHDGTDGLDLAAADLVRNIRLRSQGGVDGLKQGPVVGDNGQADAARVRELILEKLGVTV